MSDLLPQIEPGTSGSVEKLSVPIGKYLGESFHSGQDDSILSSLSRTTEDQLSHDTSPVLSADDANKKWGVGNLKFTQPTQESLARILNGRERDRMDQQAYLYSGATKERFIPGMAASMLGAMANPVDLGSMFIPFVGQEGRAAELFAAGKTIQGTLARGLITSEQIARTGVPVPKLVESMAQGAMWAGMADVPKMWEAHVEGQPNPHIGLDVLGQAAFAGLFHSSVEGLKMLHAGTTDAMSKQSVNDFLDDKDTSAHQYVPLDEHVIRYQAIQQELQERMEAEKSIDLEKIKNDIKNKDLEYSVKAAIKSNPTEDNPSGIYLGQHHWLIPQAGEEGAERGMWTNRGRFVNMDDAAKLHGLPEKSPEEVKKSGGVTSEQLLYGTGDVDEMDPLERKVYADMLDKGYTEAEAVNTVRAYNKQKMEDHFFSLPEVQQKIEAQRQAAISDWVAKKKQELSSPAKPKIPDPTVPRQHVEKYNGEADHLANGIKDDIEGLGGKVEEPETKNEEGEKITPPMENTVETAISCISEKLI